MHSIPDRDAALRRGDELWSRLSRALDARPGAPLGPETDWTGDDVYSHFDRWQRVSIQQTRRFLADGSVSIDDPDEDALNARWREEDRDVPADVLRERCLASRAELRTLLLTLDEEQWRRFGRFAAADINGEHYEHHLAVCAAEATP